VTRGLEVRRLEDALEFLAEAGEFLSAREAEHNLLLGLAGTLVKRPLLYGEPPYFAVVRRGEEIVGTALRTPPHNLVLSQLSDAGAVDALARDVADAFDHLPGVVGPKESSRRFADLWARISAGGMELGMAQRIFRADHVNVPKGVPGNMRRAEDADRARLIEWVAAFQDEAMGGHVHRPAEAVVVDYLGRGEEGGLYLWEDQRPVSVAGCGGLTPNGIRIGPVYTPPELRRNGYASALVAELTNLLLAGGRRFCFLFTDLANPTSNRIYERIGYERVADVDEYRFA
jgi:predicted GNAT family acetyltransferase